ncbi:MAG: hypothetical protein PHH14_02255 [Candidatus Margulisbacteria bacterium]|nr:hypothetical protein [Candidatus Margulisiibacteriota bacterium]
MNIIVVRYITLAIIIGCAVWWGTSPSWPPFIGFLTGLAAFIRSDVWSAKECVSNEHDKMLFNKFLVELPYDGSIKFLNDWNFNAFRKECLDQLDDFSKKWKAPEYNFANKKLNKLQNELLNNISKYLAYLGTNIWVVEQNPDFYHIPPEWQEEQPKRYDKVITTLSTFADEIVSIHKKLVSEGIKKGLKNNTEVTPLSPIN